MKNIIYLIVDGLTYDMTVNSTCHQSPMKFLNKLKEKSVVCENAYSQGPYTEAGMMGLMYGRNPLDRGGYLYGMQEWSNSLYEALFNNGYRLFSLYYGSSTPPELMTKGGYIYAMNYFTPYFSRYILGKLDYYYKIYRHNKLTEKDYSVLIKLLNKHFETMLIWQSNQAKRNDFTGDFNPCERKDASKEKMLLDWKRQVKDEYKIFKNNQKQYCEDIFKNYSTHFITSKCDVSGDHLHEDFIKQRVWIKKKYKNLFNSVRQTNTKFFIRNQQVPFRQLLKSLKISRNRFLKHLYRVYQAGFLFNINKMTATNVSQVCSSARACIRSFINWNDSADSSKPFFVYLHLDEFHRPLSFYSHDIKDKDLIEREMSKAEHYISSINYGYKGNIGFDLAAQYIDDCLSELYNYLDNKNILNNTIIIVAADHGSSNTGGNVRFTLTNNFYKEQYHIPMIIYGMSKEGTIKSFIDIKDLPYTLLKYLNIPIPCTFTGKDIFLSKATSSFVEYLGTGVPDISRRPVFYQYRSNEYSYVLKTELFPVIKTELLSYYDTTNDMFELNDISKLLSSAQVKELKDRYHDRALELKMDYINWVDEEY